MHTHTTKTRLHHQSNEIYNKKAQTTNKTFYLSAMASMSSKQTAEETIRVLNELVSLVDVSYGPHGKSTMICRKSPKEVKLTRVSGPFYPSTTNQVWKILFVYYTF